MKDLVATVLILAVAGIWYAKYANVSLPFLGTYRTAILAVLILGIAMCAVGARIQGSPWTSLPMGIVAGLGMLSFAIGVLGLIFGTKIWLDALAVVLVLMWVMTTVRHLFA